MFTCIGSWFSFGPSVAIEKKDDDTRMRVVEQWKKRFSVLHVRAADRQMIQQERVVAMVHALLLLKPLDTIEDEVTEHCKRIMEICYYDTRNTFLDELAPFVEDDLLIKRIFQALNDTHSIRPKRHQTTFFL